MNDLANEVNKILSSEVKFMEDKIRKIAKEVSKETVEYLKTIAPKRKGKYRNSFTVDESEYLTVIIHSEKHYRLTHLLEYGHDIIKKGKRVGRTKGIPHWSRAEERSVKEFKRRLVEEITNGETN